MENYIEKNGEMVLEHRYCDLTNDTIIYHTGRTIDYKNYKIHAREYFDDEKIQRFSYDIVKDNIRFGVEDSMNKAKCFVDRHIYTSQTESLNAINSGVLKISRTSLRDYFAGQALIGYIIKESSINGDIAYSAYKMADEMLKEKSREREN